MPPRFHTLTIAALHRETEDAVSLAFAVPEAVRAAYRFTPGQYLTLSAVIDGEDVRRSYSICSGLDDAELRVAIKRVTGGAFSTWANEALHVGDRISVMTPGGRFGVPIEPGAARTFAAFAAGSGITPVLSILKTVLVREPGSRFVLFYGNRTTGSIMFRGVLEDLKDRHLARLSVFHVLSREQQDVPILNGHLDAEKVDVLMRAMLPASMVDHAFVCGPQPMIEGLEKALADLGMPRDRIHVERFTPGVGGRPRAVVVPASAPPKAIATVICEGARWEIPMAAGEAIIDAALRAGRTLPFSCKGGMCCTCRAKLLEGRVEMAVNFSLEPWETEAGYILTCQAQPVTDRITVDYDQV
ncbi:MAG TPA: 1,2-phenylacetyl-CoA epoxidase subunit PaaE [Acetobacteraceae bacterium]|jgi:ring-1,2-phenylacetyl-CoA epoxidase subunit PaaE|nr:1,2-phenylacetyl-CoA epoxidase subunit PaaE [Acetobacteraceae bacterium]